MKWEGVRGLYPFVVVKGWVGFSCDRRLHVHACNRYGWERFFLGGTAVNDFVVNGFVVRLGVH